MDTDWAVYLLRGDASQIVEQVRDRREAGISVSAITVAELHVGVEQARDRAEAERALNRLLEAFPVLPFDSALAPTFGRIQSSLRERGIEIGDFDAAIAATSLYYGLTLLTNNIRHFRHVEGLKVVSAT
jgi:predicted nucleic acid-binding protein